MKLFPGQNEKLITVSIFSFSIGLGVGIAAFIQEKLFIDFLPAVATLFAAFLGAWVAFALERKDRKNKQRGLQLEAANNLLYAIYERLNALKLFQFDFIDPVRSSPAFMIEMQPVVNYRDPPSKIDAQSVAYLFQTKHRPLMLSLHVVNEQFNEAVNAIRVRSHHHLNIVQPLLEHAGMQSGQEISAKEIHGAIGDRNYHMLEGGTKAVIYHVDKFLERGDSLKQDLVKAFSDFFTPEEIFNFELLESPASQPHTAKNEVASHNNSLKSGTPQSGAP